MVNRRLLLSGGLTACVPFAKLSAQAFVVPTYQNTELMLGETSVIVQSLSNGAGPVFFHPHENESTSLRVAEEMVTQFGGTCISVRHGGGRYITFQMNGSRYRCDPNRIFTPEGVLLTLGNAPQNVRRAVGLFAAAVANRVRHGLGADGVVIGMHNNSSGAYSMRSYTSGGAMHMDAETVFVNTARDADDFFLTTERHLFDALKFRHYSVVLQKKPPLHNDGSFSVFCCQKDIPYVNVEAEEGHVVVQRKMLGDLIGILNSAPA